MPDSSGPPLASYMTSGQDRVLLPVTPDEREFVSRDMTKPTIKLQLRVIHKALENLAETENNPRLEHAAGLVNNALWALDTAEGSNENGNDASDRVARAHA